MTMTFNKATKKNARGRIAFVGPSGSGKTYTSLAVAAFLAAGGKVAVVDTEHGSASKYADRFDFDVLELDSFSPKTYTDAIKAAEAAGYAVVVIDSLTHAWSGKDGALEMVDKAKARQKNANSFTAWREVTPMHNELVETIIASRCHVIATMRSKTEYVLETVNGKQVPRKVGTAPVQREGMDFEFDIVGEIDVEHKLVVTKSRCPDVADMAALVTHYTDEFAGKVKAWLEDGAAEPDALAERVAADAPTSSPDSGDGSQDASTRKDEGGAGSRSDAVSESSGPSPESTESNEVLQGQAVKLAADLGIPADDVLKSARQRGWHGTVERLTQIKAEREASATKGAE